MEGQGREGGAHPPRDSDVSSMTRTKDKTHKASNVRMKTFINTPVTRRSPQGWGGGGEELKRIPLGAEGKLHLLSQPPKPDIRVTRYKANG